MISWMKVLCLLHFRFTWKRNPWIMFAMIAKWHICNWHAQLLSPQGFHLKSERGRMIFHFSTTRKCFLMELLISFESTFLHLNHFHLSSLAFPHFRTIFTLTKQIQVIIMIHGKKKIFNIFESSRGLHSAYLHWHGNSEGLIISKNKLCNL